MNTSFPAAPGDAFRLEGTPDARSARDLLRELKLRLASRQNLTVACTTSAPLHSAVLQLLTVADRTLKSEGLRLTIAGATGPQARDCGFFGLTHCLAVSASGGRAEGAARV